MKTKLSVQALAIVLILLSSRVVSFAPPGDGANCRSCHGTVRSGMYLTGNQSTTNLGAGLLKLYQVVQGESVPIELQITNRYSGNYGLCLLNLTTPGYSNSANKLVYTGDPTWANRTISQVNHFTIGPVGGTVPIVRPHNLLIQTNTPADIYRVQIQMAGRSGGEWSQVEDFYIQVLPAVLPPAPVPTIASPVFSLDQFSVSVDTVSGYTYYLDYKQMLDDAAWSNASQVAGDGNDKVLTDSSAADSQRYYRVRVE